MMRQEINVHWAEFWETWRPEVAFSPESIKDMARKSAAERKSLTFYTNLHMITISAESLVDFFISEVSEGEKKEASLDTQPGVPKATQEEKPTASRAPLPSYQGRGRPRKAELPPEE